LVVFSSKVGREKKKESGDSSVNGICGRGLPACCCQPAVAGGVIHAELTSELNTHLTSQALFTQSSPVCEPLLQVFPFPSTLGEVTLHLLSQAFVFIYSSCGKWVFPPSCGVFLPPPLLQVFPLLITGQCCCSCQWPCLFIAHVGGGSSPVSCGVFLPPSLSQLSHSWLLGACPTPTGPACLFTVPGRIPFPQSSVLSVPHSLSHVSLLFLLLITQFLLFPGWRSVCPGGLLLWPRVVCGSTTVPLSSPCPCLPKPSGHRRLAARGPSWFLRLT
jgi:hypothetical protein